MSCLTFGFRSLGATHSRETLVRICSAVAVHTNGFGSSLLTRGRTVPAYIKTVTDRATREKPFDGDHEFLADAIVKTDRRARQEGLRYDGWDGINDWYRDSVCGCSPSPVELTSTRLAASREAAKIGETVPNQRAVIRCPP